ncbi:MAG TPA: DNA polymerase ligase N-terminal domain-containing protein, partial [Bdellovibrionales bacterium]|nr:DNA polymerase ligase N-terminal domain-containing protein [Bdellovibrionales bacterium]
SQKEPRRAQARPPRRKDGLTMGLELYHKKRNFRKTPEPRGRLNRTERNSFVIQKHHASHLHYDFRLEMEGVLRSWAVPKGPSLDPSVKRLAMEVEDHPLDYARFEGNIPENQYGAGDVIVWDRGEWICEEDDPTEAYRNGKISFELRGEKLAGRWVLIRNSRVKSTGPKTPWFLIKRADEDARPELEFDITRARPESVITGHTLPMDAAAWTPSEAKTKKTRKPAVKKKRAKH